MNFEKNSRNKLSILMLSWEYPPHIVGGLGRHVYALSTELVKYGIEIHVITNRPGHASVYEYIDGVHVHRVSPINELDSDFFSWIGGLNLAIVNQALSITENVAIQAIHAHDWMVGAAADFIAETLNIPIVATIHGTEFGRQNGRFTELQEKIHRKENAFVHKADKLIVCSEYMEDEVVKLFEIKKKKIKTIKNGGNLSVSQAVSIDINQMYPFLKNKILVFSIGRIVKEKGFDTIISAAERLKKTHPEVCFVIAGNGPLLDYYRQLVQEKSLQSNVFFIGFISEDLREGFFSRSQVAVFPSLYEPFGIAAAEAMSFGVPTIVAKTGGLAGLVENGETGFHMESGDELSLVQRLEFILQHHEQAYLVAEEGRRKMIKEFSWESNARQTARIYDELVKKG